MSDSNETRPHVESDPDATRLSSGYASPIQEQAFIPGYENLGELGRGGMGVVFKARQIALDRVVAIKMILAGSNAGSDHLIRFQIEAEAAARIDHPNVVKIHEVGEYCGNPYLVLEFVEGESLASQLRDSNLPLRQAVEMMQSIALAMQFVHDRHILHRDLKPQNILIAQDGTPKIVDFGIARKMDSDGATQTGLIFGTPNYMSPEQAEGVKLLTPAADVYSLGAVLYHMITGLPPFQEDSVAQTLFSVIHDRPDSARSINRKIDYRLKPTTRSHATSYSWEMICGELTPRLHSSQPLSG